MPHRRPPPATAEICRSGIFVRCFCPRLAKIAIQFGRCNAAAKVLASCRQEAAMSQSNDVINDIAARYLMILGAAAADLWSTLPQELQHTLFERAIVLGHQGEGDESLREQLAKFLHDHHARTLPR
jgi:hypothetical protein